MSDNEKNNTINIEEKAEDSTIVSGDKNVIHIHKKVSDQEDKKHKFNYLMIFIAFLVVGIVSVSAIFFLKNPPPPPPKILPKFIITNRILRSDAVLIIKAGNEAANRKQPLTVEFDGLPFDEKGVPVENQADNKRQCWHFSLTEQNPPPEMLRDGRYKIRAGFTGEDLVDVQEIHFYTEVPVLRGRSYQPENEPNKRVIEGRASSNLKTAENKMAVEMVFFDEAEKPIAVDIPVMYVQNPKSGISYYEFQTTLEGLPEFSKDDPRYTKPFFGLKVTDQAGNDYYQQISYAQYIAPGDHHFGSSDLADITVEKKPDTGNRQVINLVRLIPPKQNRVDRLPNGFPPIELKVSAKTAGSRQLEWKSHVDVKAVLTLIYRDEKQIAVSKKNSYEDADKLAKDSADYRVEVEGKDGTRYLSNTETFRKPVEVLLTVKSNVKEDSVLIDGEKQGATPLNYKIMTGKHSVRVEKPGYTTFEQEIDLKKDQTVTAKLEPAASLVVETEPSGATVFVNGKKSGTAPVTLKSLKPGNIQIMAELAGYKAQEKAYPVKPENPEPVKLVMEQEIRGNIRLGNLKPQPVIKLRSTPIIVSSEEAKSKFKLNDELRPLEYVENYFKDNKDGTITDSTTGLMWQKSGAPDWMYLKDVPAYIGQLNSERFAGYSDWRLPTVDELKSLLTQEKQSNNLYINPIFDKTQRWCWTSDKCASGTAWRVHFSNGFVSWNRDNSFCVRAVRSIQ